MKHHLNLNLRYDNQHYTIRTYVGEYRNLMLLLKDNLPLDYFGECGGMGRCATCIIKTIGLTGNAAIKERNEHTTLSKIGYINDNIRLSCQILITKELENMEIELLEQQ